MVPEINCSRKMFDVLFEADSPTPNFVLYFSILFLQQQMLQLPISHFCHGSNVRYMCICSMDQNIYGVIVLRAGNLFDNFCGKSS